MRAVDGIVLTPSVRATVQSRWNIRSRCEPARKTDCCDGCLTGQDDTARRETLAETGRFFGLAGVDYGNFGLCGYPIPVVAAVGMFCGDEAVW